MRISTRKARLQRGKHLLFLGGSLPSSPQSRRQGGPKDKINRLPDPKQEHSGDQRIWEWEQMGECPEGGWEIVLVFLGFRSHRTIDRGSSGFLGLVGGGQ